MQDGEQPGMPPLRARQLGALIRSERLVLEPLTAAHADVLFLPLQDSRIYRWISALPPANLETLSRRWAALEARLSPAGEAAWPAWAIRRASDGAYVGRMDAEVRVNQVATNVGYALFPEFWRQGYATEAVRAVVEQFERQGVREARALVTCGNLASERVLLKAGFVHTRLICEGDTIRGVKHDELEYVRFRTSVDD